MDDSPAEVPASSPFTTSGGSLPAPPAAYAHSNDIFGAPPAQSLTGGVELDRPPASPFGAPETAPEPGAETKAFPSMTFDDFQQAGAEPAPPQPSPWDEPDSPMLPTGQAEEKVYETMGQGAFEEFGKRFTAGFFATPAK